MPLQKIIDPKPTTYITDVNVHIELFVVLDPNQPFDKNLNKERTELRDIIRPLGAPRSHGSMYELSQHWQYKNLPVGALTVHKVNLYISCKGFAPLTDAQKDKLRADVEAWVQNTGWEIYHDQQSRAMLANAVNIKYKEVETGGFYITP